jgi:hypothetical protein
MIGTSAALVTTTLVEWIPGGSPTEKLAWSAALVGLTVYVVGFAASFYLPEPTQQDLPD